MSCTNSPLLILCAFLCFNFYWRYIFFIPTLPVKSFKRKVCSSGLKIDKAPLLLYILLTILLGVFTFLHVLLLSYQHVLIHVFYQVHYLHAICTYFNCGKSNLRTWSPIFPVVLFLSYLHFSDFHTWVFQTEEAPGNHCSLFLYLLPAMSEYKLFKPLHRAS